MTTDPIVIENAHIAPVRGPEIPGGHLVIEGDRITAVGSGPAPGQGRRIDASGCLVTPGLVNTHHHLYQWATQGLYQDATLFEWLTGLYETWAGIDAGIVHDAAIAGLGWLALSGCTTSTDHHYVFPKGRGDLFDAEVSAARELHLRFHPCRGSMDRGRSDGGLPPDEIVEDRDEILAATESAIDAYHDPSFS
jgi:cytosine/adenosine deaminase-related metal-dependent hydrolase